MHKYIKIIKYFPKYLDRFSENIKFYFQRDKTYKDITERSSDNSLYPIDFSWWVKDGHYEIQNSNGIPVKHHIDGDAYSWSRICNYALYNFNEYKITGEANYLEKFINIADYVESNIVVDEKKNTCVLYHEYDWLELKSPWVGALVQGLIASVMMRYFLVTNDQKYLVLSEMASNMFFISVEDGGVVKKINEKNEWLEEYPTIKDSKYSFVLNGFMIALLGLYDTSTISSSKKYSERYYELMKSLNNNLHLFLVEGKSWSLYSSPRHGSNVVTPSYQSLHIVLLGFHSKISNLSFLKDVYALWERDFLNNRLRAKCLIKKLYYWVKNPNTV